MDSEDPAILIKNNIIYQNYKINLNNARIQHNVIKINDLSICSMYIAPNCQLPDNFWDSYVNRLGSSFIIMGDLKSRHAGWDCSSQNIIGNVLFNFNNNNNNNVFILNNSIPTRFSASGSSVIDLALCSSNIVPRCSFQGVDDTYGSDYFPILVKYIFRTSLLTICPYKKLKF